MDAAVYINGTQYKLSCDPRTSLSDFIRDHAGLKGTKEMCREGGCGACMVTVTSVHPVTGKRVDKAINSCLCPVGSIIGCHVTTVEGVGNQHAGFHPIQKSIADHNGSQCGYCTPGMVMNMYGLLCNKSKPSPIDIEKAFDGNLCRCTGYSGILDGVKDVMLDIEDLHKYKCPTTSMSNFDGAATNWLLPKEVKEVFEIYDRNVGRSVKMIFGNTASGFYKTKLTADIIVDLRSVKEFYNVQITENAVEFGANVTIQDMIYELENIDFEKYKQFEYLTKSLVPMLYKLGGTPVRNAGCWAGNLILRHKYPSFVSDLFTPLEALQAKITVASKVDTKSYTPSEFLTVDMTNKVIVKLTLPSLKSTTERFHTFKVADRAANSLAIVNAGFYIEMKEANGSMSKIVKGRFVYGGIQKMINAQNTEALVQNKEVSKEILKECLQMVEKDTGLEATTFQCTVARNLLYLFLKNACDPSISCDTFYENTTERMTENVNTYDYEKKTEKYPECQPMPKLDSLLMSSGEAQYVNDRPHAEKELQAYCVLSTQAKAKIANIGTSKAEAMAGVVKVVTSVDIRGQNMLLCDTSDGSPIPVLADTEVCYAGHPIAVVIAETLAAAKTGALAVEVTYSDIQTPILDVEEAVAVAKDLKPLDDPNLPQVFERGNVKEKLAQSSHVIAGKVKLGTQYHFYMETLHCLVVPYDDMLDIWLTTQGPAANQTTVSTVTGIPMSSINTHVLRIGGGFGAKIQSSGLIAAMTATAAQCVRRPVRMAVDLEQCMKLQGKRMPFLAKYKVGFSPEGKIEAMDLDYYHDYGGRPTMDTAFIINEIIKNTETVYHIPNLHFKGYALKTNKVPTVPCRAPSTVPGGFIMESIMEQICKTLNEDPVTVRQRNLIKDGDPYLRDGTFSGVTINKLWTDLVSSSKLDSWQSEVAQFNKENHLKKRGLSIVGVRNPILYFGTEMSFTAYVTAYSHDGTVSITHGGVEMGQGLYTKAVQTVAKTLGIDPAWIRNHPTASLTSANNSAVGGSIGSESVARSLLECCKELNSRLEPFKKENPDSSWKEILQKAHRMGIDLSVSKKYANLGRDGYSTYGVCAVEAEVNVLTGEHTINRLDTIFDVGESLNPTVDIGQIEGALAMSLGYYRSEVEKYHPKTGVLLSNGTWDYKPPTALDMPRNMNVKLMKGGMNHDGMMSFKGIGEPAMNCGSAVMFAVRSAVQSFRESKKQTQYFQMEQPLSPEEILKKCEVTIDDLLAA